MKEKLSVLRIGSDPIEAIENNLAFSPMQRPDLISAKDILIEVRSVGISWVDVLMMCGVYQHKPKLPYTPGLEYSGVVLELGPEAKQRGFQVGMRVFVDCFSTGPRTSGPYQQYGGLASYALAPAEAVRPIPQAFSFDQACNFAGNYETAYHALIHCGNIQKGETILIHGASGGTGLAAVHIAKAVGANVIATGRSLDKLKRVQKQGADEIVVLEKGEKDRYLFRDAVRSHNGGKGVDLVYDGVGGGVIEDSLRSLRFGGRYLVVGWASTPFVSRAQVRSNQIPSNLVLMKGLQVLGCPAVIAVQKDPSIRTRRLNDLMEWIEQGLIVPYVEGVYPVCDIKKALKDRWNGKIVGGVAVRI